MSKVHFGFGAFCFFLFIFSACSGVDHRYDPPPVVVQECEEDTLTAVRRERMEAEAEGNLGEATRLAKVEAALYEKELSLLRGYLCPDLGAEVSLLITSMNLEGVREQSEVPPSWDVKLVWLEGGEWSRIAVSHRDGCFQPYEVTRGDLAGKELPLPLVLRADGWNTSPPLKGRHNQIPAATD